LKTDLIIGNHVSNSNHAARQSSQTLNVKMPGTAASPHNLVRVVNFVDNAV
jgi:hypothetical protein